MAEQSGAGGGGRKVFHALDLLRGVAAIAVVLYHKKALPLSSTSAYLAVDLFFLLSGVVVSEAYAERLASGWSVGRFMLVRVVRLWPLYMVGTLIGLVAVTLSLATGVTPFWHGSIAKIVLFATFFLPGVHQWEGTLFPLNGAAWSLFAELAVNLFFAIVCRLRLERLWPLFIVLSAAFLLFEVHRRMGSSHGLDFGAFNFPAGVARAFFSFSMGVGIHRAWRTGRLPAIRVPTMAILFAFLAMILLAPARTAGAVFWALLIIAVGFPVLVALALDAVPGPLVRRLSALSGRISYPIYTTHLPAFAVLEAACGGPDAPSPLAFWLVGLASVAVALPLDRYVDTPIRRYMSHRLGLSDRSVDAAKPL